jgi:hypothetical protein
MASSAKELKAARYTKYARWNSAVAFCVNVRPRLSMSTSMVASPPIKPHRHLAQTYAATKVPSGFVWLKGKMQNKFQKRKYRRARHKWFCSWQAMDAKRAEAHRIMYLHAVADRIFWLTDA